MSLQMMVLIVLVAWRLASLMVNETGPGNIFLKLRQRFGIEHDDDGNPAGVPDTLMAGMFSCLWCMGVWTSGVAYVIWRYVPILSYIVAASAALVLFDSFLRWLDRD